MKVLRKTGRSEALLPLYRDAGVWKSKPLVQFPWDDALFFPGDDAREAVKHGVDGILVSNHGARQLDGVPATVSFHWGFFIYL